TTMRVGGVQDRFTHALFREAFYDALPAPQRLALHVRIALVREAAYGPQAAMHAAELAEHFAASADPADLRTALDYSEQAAARARPLPRRRPPCGPSGLTTSRRRTAWSGCGQTPASAVSAVCRARCRPVSRCSAAPVTRPCSTTTRTRAGGRRTPGCILCKPP